MTTNAQTISILVIEDDNAIRRGLVDALKFSGYSVLEADNGKDGLDLAVEASIDLVLLDVLMPGMDGFEVLNRLRAARPTLPIIMVTARGAETDRILGLETGADDYVVKPFSARELLARVEAVLRRSPQRSEAVTCLQFENATVHLLRHEIQRADGETVHLSERETAILTYLASNKGRAIDRRELLQNVWGINPRNIATRTVDMHVARLRDKIEPDPSQPRIILTVRSKGYMLSEDVVLTQSS